MTTTRRIDHDVTQALDRWVQAIGGPDHADAAKALDDILERLCDARRDDSDDVLTYLNDWADAGGLVIRCSWSPETWAKTIEELPVLDVRHWDREHVDPSNEIHEDAEAALRREMAAQ